MKILARLCDKTLVARIRRFSANVWASEGFLLSGLNCPALIAAR